MNEDQASIIEKMLDVATEGNWPHVRRQLLEFGYKPAEIVDAVSALSRLAGTDPMLTEDDF